MTPSYVSDSDPTPKVGDSDGQQSVSDDLALADDDLVDEPSLDLRLFDSVTTLDEGLNVVPQRIDEFRCSGCFLVLHRSQRVHTDPDLCADCG